MSRVEYQHDNYIPYIVDQQVQRLKLSTVDNLLLNVSLIIISPIANCYVEHMKGREPEWSNPQIIIEDGKFPEMPKNQVKLMHSVKTKL